MFPKQNSQIPIKKAAKERNKINALQIKSKSKGNI